MTKEYVEGFSFQKRGLGDSYKPDSSHYLIEKKINLVFDHSDNIEINFMDVNKLIYNQNNNCDYELLPVDEEIFLLTLHLLFENPKRNLTFVLDFNTNLVTKIDAIITTIERDSTRIVEGENLVKRNIDFGYIESTQCPCIRHHYTDELIDHSFSYFDSPFSTIYYYIHSSHKISYYQKKFPKTGNPIDEDGVGYGELDVIQINDTTYLLTFIKHSHGNQPIILWNQKNHRIVANFFGISRQLGIPFLVTGGGYTKTLY